MKLTREQIEKMFERWSEIWNCDGQGYPLLNLERCEEFNEEYDNGETHFAWQVWEAAFALLIPIIEKQQEALEYYRDTSPRKLSSQDYIVLGYDKFTQGSCARSTLTWVENEMKKMQEGV